MQLLTQQVEYIQQPQVVYVQQAPVTYAASQTYAAPVTYAAPQQVEYDLKDATDSENEAMASFDELVAAKAKEIDALTASIESKTTRPCDLAVKHR